MSLEAYLFEKACFVPQGLAWVVEDVHYLPVGSPARREISAYLAVALRHGLMSCCTISGAAFNGSWVEDLSREGSAIWKETVQPALEDAMFGPDEDDDELRAAGLPRTHAPGTEPREIDFSELMPRTTKTLASLLDLADIVRKHEGGQVAETHFLSHLSHAFNGALKVLTTLTDAEWDPQWPITLAEHGREALPGIVSRIPEKEGPRAFSAADLAPREEAWLAEVDPERTPRAEREAERRRRADVTQKTRVLHDLVIPDPYRRACLAGLLVQQVPGHQACFDYAKSPEGALVIHGELASGMYPIQWAIARHWFVDELESVGAVEWRDVVEDNLMAQARGLWECPYLIVESLCPISLADGTYADPGYAERMLDYRLTRALPTVITVERYGLEMLNFRSRTVRLLEQALNVVLSRLGEAERKGSEMFR